VRAVLETLQIPKLGNAENQLSSATRQRFSCCGL
jgi:hypothetical protein